MNTSNLAAAARTGVNPEQVSTTIDDYRTLFTDDGAESKAARRSDYAKMVNQYYDLVTDFYEYGWGQSFHFAPRRKGESFEASLLRHEHFLALQLGLQSGMKVADVGCGVGGPMRNIATFSGAEVVGVNNNAYQIERGTKHNADAGLTGQCSFVKADFMKLPFEDASFDAAYAIEAICHAPDRVPVLSEIHRCLEPGGMFASYDWCVTDNYDVNNSEHRAVIHTIEEGDALPELKHTSVVDEATKAAGFELVSARDLTGDSSPQTPWWLPLTGREKTLRGIPRTSWGRVLTHNAVKVMERVRIAPKGATAVSSLLNEAADALIKGGELGIFTPLYLVIGRKPA